MALQQMILPSHRIYAGDGSLMRMRSELQRRNAKRALIFCGQSLSRHSEAMQALRTSLGDYYVGIYDGVRAHSPIETVALGAEHIRDAKADAVVAFGGGSAIVTARAASIVYAEGKSPLELCTKKNNNGQLVSPKLLSHKIAQFVVPTTPTTAAIKAGSAVHNTPTGDRLALYDPKTRAQCLFIEPMLIKTSPAELFYTASLNTLTMAISGLEAGDDNPYAEALLRRSAELIFTWLPQLYAEPNEINARTNLMYAALLCGSGTDLTGGGLVTALSHSLGPATGIANGIINAVLLPHVMRFNENVAHHRHKRIIEPLICSDPCKKAEHQHDAPRVISDFLKSVNAPTTLSELGVDPLIFDDVAGKTMDDWSLANNPRSVTQEHVMGILLTAL